MILHWPFLEYLFILYCAKKHEQVWKCWERGRGWITADVAAISPAPTFKKGKQSQEQRAGDIGCIMWRTTRRGNKVMKDCMEEKGERNHKTSKGGASRPIVSLWNVLLQSQTYLIRAWNFGLARCFIPTAALGRSTLLTIHLMSLPALHFHPSFVRPSVN